MLAMVVSSLCFPMLGVVVRAVRQQDDVFTVMFFSGLLNCIALWTVLLVREKRGAFKTSVPHVHLIRGALGALGATSIVYSMKFKSKNKRKTLVCDCRQAIVVEPVVAEIPCQPHKWLARF